MLFTKSRIPQGSRIIPFKDTERARCPTAPRGEGKAPRTWGRTWGRARGRARAQRACESALTLNTSSRRWRQRCARPRGTGRSSERHSGSEELVCSSSLSCCLSYRVQKNPGRTVDNAPPDTSFARLSGLSGTLRVSQVTAGKLCRALHALQRRFPSFQRPRTFSSLSQSFL